ncbi:MAG: hypothetical protein ACM3IJ_04510 [Candidatus Levyibacteriota bacterium]
MKKISPILVFFLLLFTLTNASAQSMSNSSYKIDLNPSDNQPVEPPHTIIEANQINKNPESPSKIINGDNYSIELSYENDKTQLPFMVSVSSDALDYGKIEAGEPVTRSNSISVFPGEAHGFQVLAQENHALQSDTKDTIPDTSCDSGNCNNILSDQWELPLTYGFGLTCQNVNGKSCVDSFQNGYYKRFANLSFDETAASLMSQSSGSKNELQSIILYKINVAANQPDKPYANSISLIATPNL